MKLATVASCLRLNPSRTNASSSARSGALAPASARRNERPGARRLWRVAAETSITAGLLICTARACGKLRALDR